MELEGMLPCSEEPVIASCLIPTAFSPHFQNYFFHSPKSYESPLCVIISSLLLCSPFLCQNIPSKILNGLPLTWKTTFETPSPQKKHTYTFVQFKPHPLVFETQNLKLLSGSNNSLN